MPIDSLAFLAGAILVLASIVGGGLELKGLKIPRLTTSFRAIALLAGVAFIALGIWLHFSPRGQEVPAARQPQEVDVAEPPELPAIADPQSPTRAEVHELAGFYGLFTRWQVNPHLSFEAGDVSFWAEQGLGAAELEVEFESRRMVLERAERTGQFIPSQGDLSHHAEELQAGLREG